MTLATTHKDEGGQQGPPTPVVIEDECVRLALLPTLGAKIISVQDKKTGREWLWRHRNRPFRQPIYGSKFENWDISGFDECLPGIAAEPYPTFPWQGITIPDHGELWTIRWHHVHGEGSTLTLRAHGVHFPYELHKEIRLLGQGRVGFSYTLKNHSEHPFPYIWAAHPLFQVTQSTRILLPADRVTVDSALGSQLKPTTDYAWPLADIMDGTRRDLSHLNPSLGEAYKLYATHPSAGWAALHDSVTGEFIAFGFSLADLPYCGVWINQRGWPVAGEPCFNVALEPCSGCPDSLADAVGHGTHQILAGFGTAAWRLVMVIGQLARLDSVNPDGIPSGLRSPSGSPIRLDDPHTAYM